MNPKTKTKPERIPALLALFQRLRTIRGVPSLPGRPSFETRRNILRKLLRRMERDRCPRV